MTADRVLELHLLGGCSLSSDGKQIALPTRGAMALAIYVAHHPHPVQRSLLMDLLYPSHSQQQAGRNLRRELSAIKSKLGDWFTIDRHTVTATSHLIKSDAARLQDALNEPPANDDFDRLEAVLGHYHGEFLSGFFLRESNDFEAWLLQKREHLRLLVINGYLRLLRRSANDSGWQRRLHFAEKLVEIEPLLEEAQQAKLLMLARVGQRVRAIQHFDHFSALFEDELGIPVSAETTTIFRRIQRSSTPPTHRLPVFRTQFVGRETEIDQITTLFTQKHNRVITLLGMGGVGKSTLAAQTGRWLLQNDPGRFLDGIFFVELVSAETADALIRQIATALNLDVQTKQPLKKQLMQWLADRELLLILDNFEQLANRDEAVDIVAELVTQAPSVKLLVTSRVSLDLYEEYVFDLGGLSLADDAVEPPAYRLFFNRAQRQFEGDELTAAQQICHLLAGVPLGIELAAGLTRTQSPSAILTHLEASFGLLESSHRNVPGRQRSLRAVFQHSWGLLDGAAQAVLSRLSVFPDSFDEPAGLAIGLATRRDISTLCNASLLQVRPNGRYAIHPLLREFSAETVTDQATLLKTHAAYYLGWLPEANQTYLRTGSQTISAEAANIRLTWHTATQAPLENLTLLSEALLPFAKSWTRAGWQTEAMSMLKAVESLPPHDKLFARRYYHMLGALHEKSDDIEHGLDLQNRALALAGNTRDDLYAESLASKAHCLEYANRLEEAVEIMHEAVAAFRLTNSPNELGRSLWWLHRMQYKVQPNYSTALLEEARQLISFPAYRGPLLHYDGTLAIGQGKYEQALESLETSLRLLEQSGNFAQASSVTVNIAVAAAHAERWQLAEEKAAAAYELFRQADQQRGMIYAQRVQAEAKLFSGNLEDGMLQMRRVLKQSKKLNNGINIAICKCYLAYGSAKGDEENAPSLVLDALAELNQHQSQALIDNFLPLIGLALVALGFEKETVMLVGYCLSISTLEFRTKRRVDRLNTALKGTLDAAEYDHYLQSGGAYRCEQIIGRMMQALQQG